MPSKILIVLACVPLYVLNAFCDKHISSQEGNMLYNVIKFLIGSLLLLPMALTDSAPKFELGVAFCGVACGVMYAVSIIRYGIRRINKT